jgi:hypothetical protein
VDSSPFVCKIMESEQMEDGLGSACPLERTLYSGHRSGYDRGRSLDGVNLVENGGLSSYGLRHSSVGTPRLLFVEQTPSRDS